MLLYLRKKKKQIVEIIQALFGSELFYDNEVLHISAEGNQIVNTTGYAPIITTNGAVPSSTAKFGTYSMDVTGSKYATIDGTRTFNFGTANFTVEGWIYPIAGPNIAYGAAIVDARTATSSACFYFGRKGTGELGIKVNGAWIGSGTSIIQTNTWNHVAYSRIGTTGYLFLNGVLEASFTDSTTYVASATTRFGSGIESALQAGNIYIDDFRVTKNIGKYKTSFIPLTTESSVQSFSVPEYDPYWSSVLLCHKLNNSSNNVDELGRVFTNTGATYSSSIKKFGTHSAFFDGGSNLSSNTAISNFNVTSTDFTVEAWIYPTAAFSRNNNMILSTGSWALFINNTGYLCWVTQGVAIVTATGTTVPINQWSHVAATRSGTAITVWLNGVQVATNASVAAGTWAINQVQIGASSTAGQYFTGYIDEARITKGVNRYPTSFVPMQNTFPVVEKPLPSGDIFWKQTKLIAEFDNTFTNAVTGSTLTASNVTFSSAQYKVGTHSAVFNGTTSYVTCPLQTFSTGNFTVEGYAFASTLSASKVLFANSDVWSSTGGMSWSVGTADGGDTTRILFSKSGANTYSVGGVIPTNTWFHWAITKHDGVIRVYVNGVKVIHVTNVDNMSAPTGATTALIGNMNKTTHGWNGYIDSVRVTVGVARYNGETFTPSVIAHPTVGVNEYATQFSTDAFKDSTKLCLDFDRHEVVDLTGTSAIANSGVRPGVSDYIENGSAYFSGTNTSLILDANQFNLSSGNFTIEAWIKPTTAPAFAGIFGMSHNSTFQEIAITLETGVLTVYSSSGGGSWNIFSGSTGITVPIGIWSHIAVVRNGAVMTVYFNGVGTVLTTPNLTESTTLYHDVTHTPCVGAYGTYRFVGFIDNLRVTQAARYTDNFTPTARLTK